MEFVADHSQMLADSEEGPTSSEQCLMSLRHGGASGPPCPVPIVEEEAREALSSSRHSKSPSMISVVFLIMEIYPVSPFSK
jgi:hypothetical protein